MYNMFWFPNTCRESQLTMEFFQLTFLGDFVGHLMLTWSHGLVESKDNQHSEPKKVLMSFITARKRSSGQGNIFRSVCQEFCPQG